MKRMIGLVVAGSMILAAGSAFASGIDRREALQQARIEQGERSGALTPREAKHLEKKDLKLQAKVDRMRLMNGGRLTQLQRARVERQQDRLSHQIAVDKHNAVRR